MIANSPRPVQLSGSLEFNVDKLIASILDHLAADPRLSDAIVAGILNGNPRFVDGIVYGVLKGIGGTAGRETVPDRGTVQFEEIA